MKLWIVTEDTKYGTDVIILKDKPTDAQLQDMAHNTGTKYELANVYTDLYSSFETTELLTTKEHIRHNPPIIREDD
jgi:predicted DNA-binding helix-hairpin-helix protein